MALNFVVSYTFSPNTTISSSQVNTNTSDVAAVFQGLEAETKTLAKLKVDIDPTTALEVATKQYVDHYAAYRRPVLVYSSASVVNMETGINGTSGQAQILFPDGNLRTDSTSGRINCNLAQVASLSGSAQSGLRTGSAAAGTFYLIYAVKTTDNSSNFVAVADTVTPTVANFATLNSNFGTNGWVYLGAVCRGDNNAANTSIVSFVQMGASTLFNNSNNGSAVNGTGVTLGSTAGATTATWAWTSGTAVSSMPANLTGAYIKGGISTVGNSFIIQNSAATYLHAYYSDASNGLMSSPILIDARQGVKLSNGAGSSKAYDILLAGFVDGVLGVGSNPIL